MPRDSSGVYTLPAGNPVVSGTVIESTWANPTMSDIAAALTDSLSRTGNGGMSVPLKMPDGSESSPAYSFTNSPTTGMYRDDATDQLRFSINASEEFSIGADAIVLPEGTTAERPSPAEAGMFRFNTDTGDFEGFDGVDWKVVTVSNALNRIEEFVSDPTKDTFTIAYLASVGADVWINGVKINHDSYDDSSGSVVILNTPAVFGDYVEIIGYSEFEVADVYTKPETDALIADVEKRAANENGFINGGFDIWQRGTSFPIANKYTADRWRVTVSHDSNNVTREDFQAESVSGSNSKHFLQDVVTSAGQADSLSALQQKIEGVHSYNGQKITISFSAKTLAGRDIFIEAAQSFGTGGSPSSFLIIPIEKIATVGGAWEDFEVTVDIPSIAGKTIGTAGDDYLEISFWLSAGSDFAGRTDNLGQQSDTFSFSDIKVEEGDSATRFVSRPIAEELALCQRYYQDLRYDYQAYGIVGYSCLSTLGLPVTLRALPTFTYTTLSSTNLTSFELNQRGLSCVGVALTPTNTNTMVRWIGDIFIDAELP